MKRHTFRRRLFPLYIRGQKCKLHRIPGPDIMRSKVKLWKVLIFSLNYNAAALHTLRTEPFPNRREFHLINKERRWDLHQDALLQGFECLFIELKGGRVVVVACESHVQVNREQIAREIGPWIHTFEHCLN